MPLILTPKDIQKLQRRPRKPRKPRKPALAVKSHHEINERIGFVWKESVFPVMENLKKRIARKEPASEIAAYLEAEMRKADILFGREAENIVDQWKLSLDRETRAILQGVLDKSLGIDIRALVDGPMVTHALETGAVNTAHLIVSIPKTFLEDVAQAVLDNFTGAPLPEGRTLIEQIVYLGGVSKRRAKMIARDQTSKLTGLLNQTRQQSLNIDKYIWRTSKDERVAGNPALHQKKFSDKHRNHFIMEGLTCRWDDPTIYSTDHGKTWRARSKDMPQNHPGSDINCRCYAEPVIEIDKILEKAKEA